MEGPIYARHFASLSRLILTTTHDGGAVYCHIKEEIKAQAD